MSDEVKIEPAVPEHVTKIRALTKEIEDGLETVEAIPDHVREWLKSKIAAIKEHL